MLHDVIHLEDLVATFSGIELGPPPTSVTGPGPLMAALRSVVPRPDARQRTSDVFLWRPGPPRDLRCTFVGARPFRPRDSVWPSYRGRPMRFAGQLSFVDSTDIVPELPGDLLQVFFAGMEEAGGALRDVPIEELVQVEWVSSADVPSLRDGDAPADSSKPRLGNTRTYDHAFHGVRVRITECEPLACDFACGATKVGGFPTDYYGTLDRETTRDLVFLGQLGRVLPPSTVPLALVGEPERSASGAKSMLLNLDPPGMTCFFLDRDDELRIYVSADG